ncbi:MAG: hypothetical protein ABH841_00460 [Candidatus Nealsonbacteria bacterium]
MKKQFIAIFIACLIAGVFAFNAVSATSIAPITTQIDFFYSATCPHCAAEEEFLKDLQVRYPAIQVKSYEVIGSPENQALLKDFYQKYNVPEREHGFVPATFTPTKYFIGFNKQISEDIESCLIACLSGGEATSSKFKIPLLGEIDAKTISLPLLTVIVGLLDGFNPCAMWILVVLISMLLSAKSRKKIALVGGIFIFTEGLLYFLFMAAWLNVLLMMSFVSVTRILIGVFGIAFGIWRIRDFITWKPGVCKVVDEKSEGKLLQRIKNILKPSAIPATILGVIVLAIGVNLIEFFCSAGFPVIYTRILAAQGIGNFQYYLYLAFYNIFYMLDDFIVFGFAFFTLSHFQFSDKYNRYSTLAAGALILILGALLIFKPELLIFH